MIGDETGDRKRIRKTSQSILFTSPNATVGLESLSEPSYFTDLLLDQIVATITKGRNEYDGQF